MIRYLQNQDIDRKRWDECLKAAPNGLLYGYSWYLDEIGTWDALVLNDYQAVMPLTYRQKFGIRYLYVSYSAQQLGVFSTSALSEKDVLAFVDAIPSTFRYLDIRLNQGNSLSEEGLHLIRHRNQEVDLQPDYDALKAAYDTNLKRNLKKALKADWKLLKGTDGAEDVIGLFRDYKGAGLSQLEDSFYHTLHQLYQVCLQHEQAETWRVTNQKGDLVAGLLVFKDHRRLYSMLTGVSPEGRKGQAVHWVIDQLIQNYSGKPITLDFEGSNDPGLARFNLQFGAKDCLYLQLRKNQLPRGIKWLKK